MNRARAKEILAGYGPHQDRATDPELDGALALLERDVELARWFEQEQAVDEAVRRKLREIPIPAGLETRILARPRRLARREWWSRPPFLAAAAAAFAVIAFSVVRLVPPEGASWSAYQVEMLSKVTSPYRLNVETESQDQVRRSMAAAGFPSDYRLPRGLSSYPLEGGLRLQWRGHRVSVICFGSDEEHKPDVWLIVVARASLPGAPLGATPEYGTIARARTARWADAGHLYLLATQEGPSLKELL